MSSGSEAGSYSRLINFVYHSTLGLRVIRKKKKVPRMLTAPWHAAPALRVSLEVTFQGLRDDINVQRFRGGLVFKAHRLLYHLILGLRVIQKKNRRV